MGKLKWHTLSYRSVDEFEYIYIFWKPGITTVDRARLSRDEWVNWGSRGVWMFPSVRANDNHEAKFPVELPKRLIRLLTDPGDLILDCFMGSGATAVAAIMTDRNYIGIDKEPQYVKLAQHMCAKAGGARGAQVEGNSKQLDKETLQLKLLVEANTIYGFQSFQENEI